MNSSRRAAAPLTAAAAAALVAGLVVTSGGASVAAKLITSKNIKNGTITSLDVKNNALTGADVKNSSLTGADIKDGTTTGADIKDGTVTRADLQPGATTDTVIPRQRVVATAGPTEADARTAAPSVVLFRKGTLTVYAKCFTDTSGPSTHSEVYIKSSTNGAIFDSRDDTLDGGPSAADFLNTSTPETDAILEADSASANNASMDSEDDSDFTAFGTDGATLRGWTGAAVKNGSLAGGNGVYGAGNVCLFTGTITAN